MTTMYKALSKITSVAVIVTLVGCVSPAEQKAYARSLGDQELCMSWMSTGSMNQYKEALAGEVRRRGLNCNRYGNVAEEQAKAANRQSEAIRCATGCSPQRVIVEQPTQNNIYMQTGPGRITPGPTPYGR